MLLLRKILFPFTAIYHFITSLRNYFYDKGIFKSYAFHVPVIVVGNLSTGGTGKSPMVEYLIRLLHKQYKVATLSRGYKRKSSGFVLADSAATPETLGDEPFQFHRKFPEISVAVDADRVNGINKLLESEPKPEIIVLDDAFQHRRVKAGFYILLTAFNDLYKDDFLLPTGNLRESRRGAKRANVIVVTKCPPDLSIQKQNAICIRLNVSAKQKVFFTSIGYDEKVYSEKDELLVSDIVQAQKVLVAGIAKPQPFFDHLKNASDTILEFSDHHDFSDADVARIQSASSGKPIVTTEKDYVRLSQKLISDNLFYLPIKSEFLSDKEIFDKKILDFVKANSTDSVQ
ncbi:tetraacyldisaccharide 4'-kinase [Flavobacterium silvaticum]|uniref:Tetraacyldisaccharide 4'-kinase n=1 Tax=Flavobacterium silvaticum TaxID=1852020 RepID=A0A972FWM8_9FLAO|nr:tetraacyldisaccharide 4'-kinase [Flavobacterium silvaticum]NMH29377.1 tetraacyldisaccharide 4'-kinase [Flavobacterium silvaticum]